MLIVEKLSDKEKYKEENKITSNSGLIKSRWCVVVSQRSFMQKSEVIRWVLEKALAAGEYHVAGKIPDTG